MERVDPGGVPPPAEPAYGVVRARPSVGGIPVIAAREVSPLPMKLEAERLEPEPEPEPGAAVGAAQANQAARVAQLAQQQDGAHGSRPSADELVEDTSWQSQVKAHELVEQDHRAREQLGRPN